MLFASAARIDLDQTGKSRRLVSRCLEHLRDFTCTRACPGRVDRERDRGW
jgi:hypothetical protein